MNTCTVHASGTLLLDLTHLSLLDNSFKRLMTSTPSAVQGKVMLEGFTFFFIHSNNVTCIQTILHYIILVTLLLLHYITLLNLLKEIVLTLLLFF